MARDAAQTAESSTSPSHDAPAESVRSHRLAAAARLSLLFPLVVLASFYAEWLLASLVLGHPPRPSMDDPMDVPGMNWLHVGTGVALLAMLPMGLVALALNTYEASSRGLSGRVAGRRAVLVLALLAGAIAWMRWDPGRVMEWWWD